MPWARPVAEREVPRAAVATEMVKTPASDVMCVREVVTGSPVRMRAALVGDRGTLAGVPVGGASALVRSASARTRELHNR